MIMALIPVLPDFGNIAKPCRAVIELLTVIRGRLAARPRYFLHITGGRNADLGYAQRTSESVRLTGDLLEMDTRLLLFCRTRRTNVMSAANAGRLMRCAATAVVTC